MPRNSSGVYTLPSGNPVVPGTTIDAAWANDTMEDMANELTNSLSRTGAGGMLAPFRIADGAVTGPGLSYLNETNTGLYRSGAGSTWMAVLGVNTVQFSTVGMTIPVGKALTAQGNASVGGTLAVTGGTTLASFLAVTGALTASGGVFGNVTAASGTSTFNNVTINGNLDMDAGSSGTITNLPNPTNSGDAANKAYVDSQDALRLALTGGTMTGVIAMSNNKVTGVATPSADQDAANKAYVDSVAQGLDAKASCRAATTANITLSGTQTIDGVAVIAGERVLVKNQSSAADNGIYVAAASTWSRAADANTWDELVAAFTFIENGTDNGNNGYICTIAPGGTLGVTAVTWAQFSGAGQITAGQGLSKTGNTIQVNTASSSRIVIGADDIDLATTGVVADTYKSVSVDAYGRVTAGTNPTTLSGFGIGDAYTQTQTNTLLNAKLSLTGGTMAGALAMGTNKITGLGDPTTAQDAATKNYIDTIFGSTATAAASAAAAASSASAASTSATNSAASATAASGSATAAASSATAAAASYDSFDDRYLGAKASDPTVDNDGNSLLTGALYWNTTSNQMRVYNGAAWEATYLPASGYALLAAANTFTANQTITANTSSAALSITQTGSGNALYIEDVAADATPFVVSSTGAVGIGTTTPDNVTSAGIALVSENGYYPQVVNRNKANDSTASYLVFDKDRAGAIVQNGDALGAIVWRSFDGANYLQSAAIIGYADGTPGSNDVPGVLTFFTTADGASAPTERLRISNTGAGTATADWTFNGVRVGRGAGAVATNTAVGASALAANTSGDSNVGVGFNALAANTTGTYNVSVGRNSLLSNTTGNSTSAFGHTALNSNTTGGNNTGIGFQSLYSNTTANGGTAIGYQALNANTTTSFNTAVGYGAGLSNTTGGVVAVGTFALKLNTTGYANTAVGGYDANANVSAALASNTTGSFNTAMGTGALTANTTSGNNTAVGYGAGTTFNGSGNTYHTFVGANAGRSTTTGDYNTALGGLALYSNTTASNNTAVGVQALQANTTASNNTAVGYQAGYVNTTGSENVFVGQTAGYNNTTGTLNTFVGYNSGAQVTTGTKNSILGRYNGNQGGLDIRTASNYIVLSDGDGNPRLYSAGGGGTNFIGETGNFCNSSYNKGTGSQLYTDFRVGWTSAASPGTQTGYISTNGTTTSYVTSSDYRLKEAIAPMTGALAKVLALIPVTYKWKADGSDGQGFIAHELAEVVPDCVTGEKDAVDADGKPEYQGIDVSFLVATLTAAIQEQQAILVSFKAEFDAYKASHP